MKQKIPLFKIHSDKEDIRIVSDLINSNMDWATGNYVLRFEESIAEYVGTKFALTFNSGTSALHSLMIAYGFKEGDEIIVPSFSFIATANAPLFVRAKPIFADIEEETFGLDSNDVNEKITNKTKAIIPIHYGGSGCKIKGLQEIANDRNLILIEDTAESLGAEIDGVRIGNFGDSAIFSFCAPKIISTGEGGAITMNSKSLYEKLKLIRSHGRKETADYFSNSGTNEYVALGYNFRMSNILASLGYSQLRSIESKIRNRRRCANYFTSGLKNINSLTIPKSPRGYYNVFQMYSIRIKEKRNQLMKFLNSEGMATKIYFSPIHLTHFYKSILKYDVQLPVTEKISNEILSIPIFPSLKNNELDYIINKIKEFYYK